MKKQNKQGFTLVEIMIVVMIIGLLAAIALPGFKKAREQAREKACQNNMRLIDAAVDQYAMETGAADNDTVTIATLVDSGNGYLKSAPECPEGNLAYGDQTVGVASACPAPAPLTHESAQN